jgi:protein-S-isoprenylcysteine O-methyltransferase Ste14
MRYEEAILTSAFAEYGEYKKRVGALFSSPRLALGKRTATAPGI